MKIIKLFLLGSLLFFFTGCYNYRELNQLAITSAIGIDKTEDGYKVTVQVINTQKQGSGSNSSGEQPQFFVYENEGKTLQEAFRYLILESPRRLYVNHTVLLLMSEEVARDGILNVLDLFFRDSEFNKQFLTAVVKESSARDVLTILTPLETLNSKNLKDSILTDSKFLGVAEEISLEKFMDHYLNDKKDGILPVIELIGNAEEGDKEDNLKQSAPKNSLILSAMAVFKEDKMVGYLTEDESLITSYLKDKIHNTIITGSCEDGGNVAVEIVKSKTKFDVGKDSNKLKISVESSGNINEITCQMDLTKNETIHKLEEYFEDQLKDQLFKTISSVHEQFNSDIFAFEDMFYKKNPSNYYKLKEEYKEEFLKNIDYEIEVKINLLAKGNIIEVIH